MEAPGGGRQPRAPEAEMGGPDKGEGDAGMDVATDWGVGSVPLLSEVGRETLEECLGFSAKKAISRGNKGDKVPAVGVAGSSILALLLIFAGAKGGWGSPGPVGVTIQVGNGAVNNAVLGTIKEATDKDVPPLLGANGLTGSGGRGRRGNSGGSRGSLGGTVGGKGGSPDRVDVGFQVDSRGGQGSGEKGGKFIP